MQTEAIYDNVADHFKSEISKAKKSVFIADAWFDNKDIFKVLINKTKSGCRVSLFISEDCFNKNPGIYYQLLEKYGSEYYIVSDREKQLIHNKFCIIDYSTVITRNYCLNPKGGSDFENLIINYNDTALAGQILASFNKISKHYNKSESVYTSESKQVTNWDNPEIVALQLEVKILEIQVNVFENEKIEIEKLLSDFHYRHTIELGDVILEILKLRFLKYRKYTEKREEAEKDYKRYNKQVIQEKNRSRFELAREEMVELKKKFRKATFMCHPDKVGEKYKVSVQSIFIDLKTAYEANDLKRVTEILSNLEKGNMFKSVSDSISKKDQLSAVISKLVHRLKTLESEIYAIRLSEAFRTISNIEDWDAYFSRTRELLGKELEVLKAETDKLISDLMN